METSFLTDILSALVNATSNGFSSVNGAAENLFYKLLIIELVFFGIGIALNRIDVQRELVAKVIAIGFVQFFLFRYVWLVDSMRDSFVGLGLLASGNKMPVAQFLDPSAFMDIGFSRVYDIIGGRLSDTGVWSFLTKPSAIWLFYGVVLLLMFFAFAAVSLQIFLAIAEFYIISSIAIIFLPFMLLQRTSFLGLRALNGLVAICIKLMVMAFIAGLSFPIINDLNFTTEDPTIRQSMTMAVSALALALLMWRAPSIAMSLIAGAGGESGSGIMAPALRGANMVTGGIGQIYSGIKAGGGTVLNQVSKAANLRRGK